MVIADLVDTLSRIGAIGGILSIIGVGLLILLVASQNRQIRSMREWIDEEPQRQQETAQRVIAEVQRRIAAARERRAASVAPAPEIPVPVPGVPRAPAPGTLGATPEAQAVAAGKELVPPGTAESAEGGEGATPPAPPDDPNAPKFAPLTPAGGAEAADGSVPPPPATPDDDEPAVVSEFLNQETQVADALPDDEPVIPASNRADARYSDEHFDLHEEEHEGGSRVLFGVGVAALLAGIVIAGFVLFGGGDDKKADTASGSGDTAGEVDNGDGGGATEEPKETTPAVDPSTINVRVLNGTSISGLAQRVTDDLKAKGYGPDRPDTFTGEQTVSVTSIEYRQGNKEAAVAVAKDLGLPESSVKAIDTNLSVAAGQNADVVVLAGSDIDSSASGTTAE